MLKSWWRTYFGVDFFQLHVDLFPEKVSRREVAGMIELLGLPVGSSLLDCPCGWGRHTRLLAEAGFDVVGADLSSGLLERAERAAPLCAADLRCLPFAARSFDGALNVFTSLGLFLDDAEDIAALREVRRVLRAGGCFLLETMHRDEVLSDYAERDQWTLPDRTEVRVRRQFDPISGISHEELHWRRGRESGVKQHALRLRTATEVAGLLQSAGFSSIRYYGDWAGSPFSHRSPHLIAVARA